jgi:photosystem II stability/assembly factor-like uncharacterized protein
MELLSVSADTGHSPQRQNKGTKRPRRWLGLPLVVLIAVVAATVWQVLFNRQPTVPIAGRPLSSTQTHLHTVVMSSRPGVIYLGTHFGLFTSTDDGRTWPQRVGDLNTTMITSIAVSPTNPDLLAALAVPDGNPAGREGIYVSADAGNHWQFTLPPHLSASGYPYSIQGAPGAQGHFYVFFSQDGWFETRDLGRHWQAITSDPLTGIQTPSLLIDPTNPEHLLMGGDQGLFETISDGQRWQQVTDVQGSVLSLASVPARASHPQIVLCATDQGRYRQQGQGSFLPLHTLPTSSPPTRVLFSPDGSALYALVGTDLWFSRDLGTTWTHRWHFARGDLMSLVINPQNPQELLAGFFWPGLVLISRNAGFSWHTLTD